MRNVVNADSVNVNYWFQFGSSGRGILKGRALDLRGESVRWSESSYWQKMACAAATICSRIGRIKIKVKSQEKAHRK